MFKRYMATSLTTMAVILNTSGLLSAANAYATKKATPALQMMTQQKSAKANVKVIEGVVKMKSSRRITIRRSIRIRGKESLNGTSLRGLAQGTETLNTTNLNTMTFNATILNTKELHFNSDRTEEVSESKKSNSGYQLSIKNGRFILSPLTAPHNRELKQ